MKIAIPSQDDRGLESQVSEHFGKARYYTFVSTDSMDVKVLPVPFQEHGPGDIPNFLRENGAEAVIAYGMGGRAVQFFQEMGIEVITGARGRIGDVVRAFMEARLSVDQDWKNRPDFGEHNH